MPDDSLFKTLFSRVQPYIDPVQTGLEWLDSKLPNPVMHYTANDIERIRGQKLTNFLTGEPVKTPAYQPPPAPIYSKGK